jgi:hypothetical protein
VTGEPSRKNGPLETPLRLAFTATGALKLWRGAFGLFEKLGALVPETVKAGMLDKYGLDEAPSIPTINWCRETSRSIAVYAPR